MSEKDAKAQLSRIDLNLLVLFDAMAKHLHVGEAASYLNLSPSAVSHGLTRLRRLLNDPLFVKHPKGMIATERAARLRVPIEEILISVTAIINSSKSFEPSTAERVFRLGTSDGFSSRLPLVLQEVSLLAPKISVVVSNLNRETIISDLDLGKCDIAVAPFEAVPKRFASRSLYEETFAVAMREGHNFERQRSLQAYCRYEHVLVAPRGIPRSPIDDLLERHGLNRTIRASVPNFFLALDLIQNSDMLCIMPSSFLGAHGPKFNIGVVPMPFDAGHFHVQAVAPRSALHDDGIVWLLDVIERTMKGEH